MPLRRHGLFLWTVLHRLRVCAAPSSHETQLLHSRSGFWVHALHLLFRSLVRYHTCLEVDRHANRNVKPERPNFKYRLRSSGTSEAQDMAGRTARVENAVARLALVRRSAAEGTSAKNLRARSHVRATPSKDLDRDRRQRENWELKDDGRPDDPRARTPVTKLRRRQSRESWTDWKNPACTKLRRVKNTARWQRTTTR